MSDLRRRLLVIDLDRFSRSTSSVSGRRFDPADADRRDPQAADTLAGSPATVRPDPDVGTGAGAHHRFAETIRKTIRAPIAFNDREIFYARSAGAERSADPTLDEISRTPSLRMYHSKRIRRPHRCL